MNGVPTILGGDEMQMVLFVCLTIAFVMGMLIYSWRRVSENRQRERSRREIAAYVAEGTIAPEDAAALLGLGPVVEASLADAIESGTLKGDDVEKIVRAAIRGARGG